MGVVAIDQHRLLLAELRPARAAVVAHRAALVMVDHDALANLGLRLADPGADRGNDAAGLVPGDDWLGRRRQPADRRAALRPPVLVQIAAAHARRLHLDDDLALARRRIGEVHQLELPFALKHDPAHSSLLPADMGFTAMLA